MIIFVEIKKVAGGKYIEHNYKAKIVLFLIWCLSRNHLADMDRANLPFDIRHFEKLRKAGRQLTTKETFNEIFRSNHWSSKSSKSGTGSEEIQTQEIRRQIPRLLDEFGITTVIDIPCGDFRWFSKMKLDLDQYIGGDIIESIVAKNQETYGGKNLQFLTIDLIRDSLPTAEILLCRDCFVHLSYHDIFLALDNIKGSNIKYLLFRNNHII